jgi:hypothetical protein
MRNEKIRCIFDVISLLHSWVRVRTVVERWELMQALQQPKQSRSQEQ